MGIARMIAGFVALLPLLAGGCQVRPRPTADVVGAEVTALSAEGFVVTFTLDATNRAGAALPLREVEYTLHMDGERVFSGTRSAEATLGRESSQLIVLPAAVPVSPERPPPTGPVEFRVNGTITYISPSRLVEVLVDAGLPRPRIRFAESVVVEVR